MIEIKKDPTKRELTWFGILLAIFLAGVGGFIHWKTAGSGRWHWILYGLAVGLPLLYFAVPPLRKPIYLAWIYAAFPIGWTVSHLLLIVVYYVVLTPISLIKRLFSDPLQRELQPEAASYWEPRRQPEGPQRYFRQS